MNKFPEIKCENEIALSVLTGSHNYNLNTENSDRDYKFFVYPTFDDLYYGKRYATSLQSEDVDYTVHDIRSLGELTFKANLNFLEVWFSRQVSTKDDYISRLYAHRVYLATANLPGFFNATLGMHYEKLGAMHKGTANTMELVEKFGYDTKQACHSLRCLYVLERFMEKWDFCNAIYFDDNDPQRKMLLDLKAGLVPETDFLAIVNLWHDTKQESIKKVYHSMPVHSEYKDLLENNIRFAVEDKLGIKHDYRVILA